MKTCECCRTSIADNEHQCSYCHFDLPSILSIHDKAKTEAVLKEEGAKHREEILEKITQISLKAEEFKWNPSTGIYTSKDKKELFPWNLNGIKCGGHNPVYSESWLAHVAGKADITVEYSFENKKKSVSVALNLPQGEEGLWHLGLHINDFLELEVLLGIKPVNEKRFSKEDVLCTTKLKLYS